MPAKNKGFTLVETLVAVAVLMIAVAGPLVVANKGLIGALYAKDQSMATFLAQEAMELIRNAKDERIYADSTDGFNQFLTENSTGITACQGDGHPCAVYVRHPTTAPETRFFSCTGNLPQCLMHKFNNPPTNYTHIDLTAGDNPNLYTPTTYTRYFYWDRINATEIQVTVVVKWENGSISNETRLSSEMVASVL